MVVVPLHAEDQILAHVQNKCPSTENCARPLVFFHGRDKALLTCFLLGLRTAVCITSFIASHLPSLAHLPGRVDRYRKRKGIRIADGRGQPQERHRCFPDLLQDPQVLRL